MAFLKRLFGRTEKAAPATDPVSGYHDDPDAQVHRDTRVRMEAELASDRVRRGATDVRPVDSGK